MSDREVPGSTSGYEERSNELRYHDLQRLFIVFVQGERERLRNDECRTSLTRSPWERGSGRGVDEKESGRTTGRGPSVSDTRAKVAVAADDENYAYNSSRLLRNRLTSGLYYVIISRLLRAYGAVRPFVTTCTRAFQTGVCIETPKMTSKAVGYFTGFFRIGFLEFHGRRRARVFVFVPKTKFSHVHSGGQPQDECDGRSHRVQTPGCVPDEGGRLPRPSIRKSQNPFISCLNPGFPKNSVEFAPVCVY